MHRSVGAGSQVRPSVHLTIREEQIVQLLIAGSRPKQIALDLGLSLYTVQNYLRNACRRTRARDTMDLIVTVIASNPDVLATSGKHRS